MDLDAMNIKILRQLNGLTQRQLAELLGTNQPVVAMAESGSIRLSAAHMEKLVEILKAADPRSQRVIRAVRGWSHESL
ncbi:MAG: helix-turn-helix domain-containing protein [Bacillota bacterium]